MVNCNPKHRYNRCDKCKWNRHGMRAVTDYFEIYTISSFMKKKFETNFMISRALCKVEQSKQNKNKNYFSPDFLEMATHSLNVHFFFKFLSKIFLSNFFS